MKKGIFFLLSALVIGTYGSNAQDKDKQKVGGIRAGFQSAYMVEEGSKPDTANSLNSFYVNSDCKKMDTFQHAHLNT